MTSMTHRKNPNLPKGVREEEACVGRDDGTATCHTSQVRFGTWANVNSDVIVSTLGDFRAIAESRPNFWLVPCARRRAAAKSQLNLHSVSFARPATHTARRPAMRHLPVKLRWSAISWWVAEKDKKNFLWTWARGHSRRSRVPRRQAAPLRRGSSSSLAFRCVSSRWPISTVLSRSSALAPADFGFVLKATRDAVLHRPGHQIVSSRCAGKGSRCRRDPVSVNRGEGRLQAPAQHLANCARTAIELVVLSDQLQRAGQRLSSFTHSISFGEPTRSSAIA